MDTHIVILAAGKGTRMKSALPKVLHRVAGLAMIDHVIATAAVLQPRSTTVVIGHQAASLETALAARQGLRFVVQEPQLGTARTRCSPRSQSWARRRNPGPVVRRRSAAVLAQTLRILRDKHDSTRAAATIVTAIGRPHRARRIVRSGEQIARIVEKRTPPRRARNQRSTLAFTHLHSRGSLMRCEHRGAERAE
jgi:bifunctional UDP-N-acetylglucosamine pyrophosphorylase/glucosamine-1-phosphate N-acetyltransferase